MPESAHEYGPIATGTPGRPTSSKVPCPRNHGGTEIDRISLQANQGPQKITQSSSIHFRTAEDLLDSACKMRKSDPLSGCFNCASKMLYFGHSDPLSLNSGQSKRRSGAHPGKAAKSGRTTIGYNCLDQPITQVASCPVLCGDAAHRRSRKSISGSASSSSRMESTPLPAHKGAHPEHVRGDRAH